MIGSTVPAPLASSVLELAQDLPAPPSPEDVVTPAKTEQTKSNNPLSGLTSGGLEKKVPKWLKLGSKPIIVIALQNNLAKMCLLEK